MSVLARSRMESKFETIVHSIKPRSVAVIIEKDSHSR